MKLTQGYIDRKHEELMGRLEESAVKAIIEHLQVQLELRMIEEELSNGGLGKPTMLINGNTCDVGARKPGRPRIHFDRKAYQREYMRKYRQRRKP